MLALALAAFGSADCSRRSSTSPAADAAPNEVTSAGALAPPIAPPALPSGAPSIPPVAPVPAASAKAFTAPLLPTVGEARRTTLARFEAEPLLRPQAAILHQHFGEGAKGPFHLQKVELATGATALLIARADESDPIVLVVDRDTLQWSKPRPTAGMVTPVQELAMAARPDGGVALFVWVTELHTVAARTWADDGNAFGDFEIYKPEVCDALSAAYVPGSGWIVACSSPAGARVQRWREDGTDAWTREGVALGVTASVGPPTIAVDSPASFVFLERAASVGGNRLLAFRYDLGAQPLWPAPLDLGVAEPSPSGRFDASVVRQGSETGVVRVELRRGASRALIAEIRPDGTKKLTPP